ncbi:respiratory nitrate reductase subunit gamma [Streptomyces sp. NPDC001292]|uniref:respiratory nitrate reductase subunit gamma n=1 Tax=Streptomyces sp. NPDC001292 TaxID=3364558 RepID=UPI0036926F9E
MSGAPLLFQLHALSALLLFAAWPFTRPAHMLTAPADCLTRPYVVHRSREPRLGARRPGAAGSASDDGGRHTVIRWRRFPALPYGEARITRRPSAAAGSLSALRKRRCDPWLSR